MPYSKGTRLPGEGASKLGHLAVVQSDWIKSLVAAFEGTSAEATDQTQTSWTEFDPLVAKPLRNVWAVDGSFVAIRTEEKPAREVAYIKTALLSVDRAKIDAIDKEHPHPLLLRDVLADSAVFHSTAFPLKNIRTSLGNNYDAVRHIVRDSILADQNGAFHETLKWIAYQKWSPTPCPSPSFACPHCHHAIAPGLPIDADEGKCPKCNKLVFLSDMIGFHLDMDEESAPDSVSSAYMLIMELLMLFTAVRLMWHHTDQQLVSDTLFIKDGPLNLRGQYSKLVPSLRAFMQYTKTQHRPVHIIGQEKSGAFFDHLAAIVRTAPPNGRGEKPTYAVLSHDYVRREVYRSPDLSNPYGSRTNWGEKVYLKLDPGCHMVLSVPTGDYDPADSFPGVSDLIGFDRILATLPGITSHKFEGALYPVELANGIASMSSYPSARILQRFTEDSGSSQ